MFNIYAVIYLAAQKVMQSVGYWSPVVSIICVNRYPVDK